MIRTTLTAAGLSAALIAAMPAQAGLFDDLAGYSDTSGQEATVQAGATWGLDRVD